VNQEVRVTLRDIEKVLPLKSWWAIIAVLPVVRWLTLAVVNHTRITPNTITISSITLRIFAAGAFTCSDRLALMAGAVFFYCAYVLDCMDGAVARLRQQSSEFGRFLDHVGDLFGGIICLAALGYRQGSLLSPVIAGILVCHLSEYYISYLTSTIIQIRSSHVPGGFWAKGAGAAYIRYRSLFHSRNVKSFFSFPDYEALIFFLFPLAGFPSYAFTVCFMVILVVLMYNIFSTFVTIHTGGTRFP